MDNQHKMIKGYRDLSAEEIALMNEIKEKGASLGELIAKLEAAHKTEADALQVTAQGEQFNAIVEPFFDARRWTSIGKTHIQQGLMALTRAVARPNFF